MVSKAQHDPQSVDADGDGRRTHVLDTSVLLSDPRAILRFAEHDVVLPVVVITELEAKRHHAELGYFARSALRMLDDLRIEHGRLDIPIPLGDEGGTLAGRAEPHRPDASCRPASGSATTTPGSSPSRPTSPPRATTSRRLQGPADARQGVGRAA